MGNRPTCSNFLPIAELPDGLTIFAASRPDQSAFLANGRSVFTDLLICGLNGGAADVRGQVTAASLHSYIEASFGARDQRPIYKSHAQELPPVQQCKPAVAGDALRKLCVHFPEPRAAF